MASFKSLQKVYLAADVYLTCMTHALSTEVEEVMGLLIGWTDYETGVVCVTHCVQLKRLDKRKDRVEISAEQLGEMFPFVEQLNEQRKSDTAQGIGVYGGSGMGPMGMLMRNAHLKELTVVGWYHSHPHITVFPSEVDIRTQNQYQAQLDAYWVGLIFGVFNQDAQGQGRSPYIAFQAGASEDMDFPDIGVSTSSSHSGSGFSIPKHNPTGSPHRLLPVLILPRSSPGLGETSVRNLVNLPKLVVEESQEALGRNDGGSDPNLDTVTSVHNAAVYAQSICNIVGRLSKPLIETLVTRRKLLEAKMCT